MKRVKQFSVLILLLGMITSNLTVIYGAEDKTNVEIIEELGIMKGEGNGLTDEYLAKENKRWQVALISLRLLGKYDEAIVYEGIDNFSDADQVTWATARVALAYLKAHPELGWNGTGDDEFNPNEYMTVQGYYKVMLEILGYKQNDDFTWDEVLSFSEKIGIKVTLETKKLTNRDIANISCEVLNAKTKDGAILMDTIVKAGVAEYEEPVKVAMTEAKVIDNTTVKVTFDDTTEISNNDFVFTDGNEIIDVTNVTSIENRKAALLTVGELKVGNNYTVTYGEVSKVVQLEIIDDVKPTIIYARAVTGKVVTVIFDTININKDTIVADNFSIDNDVTVISAEMDIDAMEKEENVDKTVVNLTVSGLRAGKAYTVKSMDVKSCEGSVADINESKAVFAGKNGDINKDDVKPIMISARAVTGTVIEVLFNTKNINMDTLVADNFSISRDVTVMSVEIDMNAMEKEENVGKTVVNVTVSGLQAGKAYVIKSTGIESCEGLIADINESKATFAGKD